jgi:hypothetical protein
LLTKLCFLRSQGELAEEAGIACPAKQFVLLVSKDKGALLAR